VDTFICCAPRIGAGKPIVETRLDEFRGILYRSALSSWLGQKHAIMAMRAHGRGGTIVHITSVLARAVANAAAARCAAEAGILMSAKAAALECAKHEDNILVHTLLAGPIEGDASDGLPQGAPRVAPRDIAAAALFLASDAASYMTGTELAVDRGFLSR